MVKRDENVQFGAPPLSSGHPSEASCNPSHARNVGDTCVPSATGIRLRVSGSCRGSVDHPEFPFLPQGSGAAPNYPFTNKLSRTHSGWCFVFRCSLEVGSVSLRVVLWQVRDSVLSARHGRPPTCVLMAEKRKQGLHSSRAAGSQGSGKDGAGRRVQRSKCRAAVRHQVLLALTARGTARPQGVELSLPTVGRGSTESALCWASTRHHRVSTLGPPSSLAMSQSPVRLGRWPGKWREDATRPAHRRVGGGRARPSPRQGSPVPVCPAGVKLTFLLLLFLSSSLPSTGPA